jgi:hypothetical protein
MIVCSHKLMLFIEIADIKKVYMNTFDNIFIASVPPDVSSEHTFSALFLIPCIFNDGLNTSVVNELSFNLVFLDRYCQTTINMYQLRLSILCYR